MTQFDPVKSLNPHIRNLPSYDALEDLEGLVSAYGLEATDILKLDGNENAFGPSPKALAALQTNYDPGRYADASQIRLRSAIADYVGVQPKHIVAGAGSDELIGLIYSLWVSSEDTVVTAGPTFGMYAFGSALHGSNFIDVPRLGDWSIDTATLLAAAQDAKVVFLASPNNPTGNQLQPELIDKIIETGALLVLDEAYIEFTQTESAAVRAASESALIVLRTFSKWGGIAGMRVGYAVSGERSIDAMLRAKQPYNISTASEAAALASLQDTEILNERARILVKERGRLAEIMNQTEYLRPSTSDANFLLVQVLDGRSGHEISEALRRRGIFVRTYNDDRLVNYFRISIGTPKQNVRIIDAIAEIGDKDV